ncbi:hypothetical protein TNCV_1923851 [Trichonephila clavipes]|nr:hypothetical protein TNCV_1923851 [Trichonephila clavipes]
MVCPRVITTSKCSLEGDLPSSYYKDCFTSSLRIQHHIVEQFLRGKRSIPQFTSVSVLGSMPVFSIGRLGRAPKGPDKLAALTRFSGYEF